MIDAGNISQPLQFRRNTYLLGNIIFQVFYPARIAASRAPLAPVKSCTMGLRYLPKVGHMSINATKANNSCIDSFANASLHVFRYDCWYVECTANYHLSQPRTNALFVRAKLSFF